MIKGYGTKLEQNEQNFTSVGSQQSGQQFGAAVAPVPLLKNVNMDNLNPLQQDSVQLEYSQQVPSASDESFLGDLRYTLPLWFVLGKGVDYYNSKCSGDYMNSLPAKIGRLGDKIATSKFAQSPIVKGVGEKVSTVAAEVTSRLRSNSPLMRHVMEHSTKPEFEAARYAMNTQAQELSTEVKHLFDAYAGGKTPRFLNIIPSSAENDFVMNFLGKSASNADKVHALQLYRSNPAKFNDPATIKAILSQRASNPKIIQEILLKEAGCDLATFEKYMKDPTKYVKELRDLSLKLGKDFKLYKGNYTLVGPLFRRKIDMSQIANKMISISKDVIVDVSGNKLPLTTELGRRMALTAQGLMRGLTFGGGKIALLIMLIPGLVDMYRNTKEAPEDQKAGTIAHGLVESVSWVATFPLGMKLMHKIGGLRYLGMTPNQVETYRNALQQFNETNKAGGFATKEAYFKAWEKVKALRTPNRKLNIFEKGLKFVGGAITQDLEMRSSWKNPALKGIKSIGNVFRGKNIGNFFRHCGGTVGKIGLFLGLSSAVVAPIISKPLEWIFGKPYNRLEEAEKKAAEMPSVAPASPYQPQSQAPSPAVIDAIDNFNRQMQNSNVAQGPNIASQENLVNATQQGYVPSPSPVVEANNRYIPSQTCDIPRDSGEFNERTYMPSQNSEVVITPENLQGLDIIEHKAALAEQNALEMLSRRV